jgi:hypothetical protein
MPTSPTATEAIKSLEAFASHRANRGTAAQIDIDGLDLLEPEQPSAICQLILQALAFGVVLHLSLRGLTQIHDRLAL